VCVCLFARVCVWPVLHQDLGSSGGPPRNWKGIGIALVVIVGVMSLVIMSVIVLTPGKQTERGPNQEGRVCTLHRILDET
jgi:hypothetical protein